MRAAELAGVTAGVFARISSNGRSEPYHPITLTPQHPSSPLPDIGVDEARARILAACRPLPAVRLPLDEALGLVLAVDIIAGSDLPAFANAAMDGFAVRAEDAGDASPRQPALLQVIAEAAAGYACETPVVPGTAMRIMTGAPIPPGADAVVRFEETDEGCDGLVRSPGMAVGIYAPVRAGDNVRPAGEDVRAGDHVLAAGTRVRPAEIGVLAALNRTRVTVHRRPRVGVLATGDELVDPGEPLGPGQIRNSNAPMVAALVRRCGGEAVLLGTARDTVDDLKGRLQMAASLDLLLTTGGVSVGDYDLVKRVLQAEGRIDLWQVRIKPGKPLAFGWLRDTPVIGLPGNPVAAAIAFEQFARPAVHTMLGRRSIEIPTIEARLDGRIENRGGRRHYARVSVEMTTSGYVARVGGAQGSGVLSTLARANGLLVIPEECCCANDGERYPVQMLDWELG